MKIALLRHARVYFKEPLFSTAATYIRNRILYDISRIDPTTTRVSRAQYPECYVSSMCRARTTAAIVYDGTPSIWPELSEVENTPVGFPNWFLPTTIRKVISRVAWFFNYRKMVETRSESMARARDVVYALLHDHADTLLVTHGFFMRCLQHELHKSGFRGSIGFSPRNAELYVFESADA